MHDILRVGRISTTDKARSVFKSSGNVAKEWRDGRADGVGLAVDKGSKYRTATRSATRTDRVIPVSDNSLFVGIDGSCRKAINLVRPELSPHAVDTVSNAGMEGENNV